MGEQSQITKTVLYDKFLSIEAWALRGKNLIEADMQQKAIMAVKTIEKDLAVLKILLKIPEKV